MLKTHIFQKGEPALKERAKEVKIGEIMTPRVRKIISRMSEALKVAENGVGLAAPQIGLPLRIFLVSEEVVSKDAQDNSLSVEEIKKLRQKSWNPLVFINPKLIKTSAKKKFLNEGCLSVDGVFGKVKRAEKVFFEAYDGKGEKIKRGASGLFAQVVQHELDHLDGVLFVEKAIELKKEIKEKKNG